MFRSAFKRYRLLFFCGGMVAVIAACGFSYYSNRQQAINWGNQCFYQSFDPMAGAKLKKWELIVTPDAFVRLRKTYLTGKQEYWSLSLRSFADMDYLGNTTKGILQISTKGEDVIVQTYNDPKGNIDSMSTMLTIPLKNMDAERVDSLFNAFLYLKTAQ